MWRSSLQMSASNTSIDLNLSSASSPRPAKYARASRKFMFLKRSVGTAKPKGTNATSFVQNSSQVEQSFPFHNAKSYGTASIPMRCAIWKERYSE